MSACDCSQATLQGLPGLRLPPANFLCCTSLNCDSLPRESLFLGQSLVTPSQGPNKPGKLAQRSFSAVNVLEDLVDVPEAIGCVENKILDLW